MRGREIPRPEWGTFLEEFTRAHRGHLCALELFGDGLRSLRLCPLMLAAIGTDDDDESVASVRVLLADWGGGSIGRCIDAPRHVVLDRAADGVGETLAIDGAGGKVLMTFQPAD